MGYSNNACYVVSYEQSAWRHPESLDLSIKNYQRLDRGVVIRKASYKYFLQALENVDLLIPPWLTACDEEFRLGPCFQMIRVATDKTLRQDYWELICVALSSGKVTKFPKEFIENYANAVLSDEWR